MKLETLQKRWAKIRPNYRGIARDFVVVWFAPCGLQAVAVFVQIVTIAPVFARFWTLCASNMRLGTMPRAEG